MPTAVESKVAPMTSHADYFLKFGDIKGESTADKHSGEIDILGFRFGVQQPGAAAAVGQGAGVGKAQFHEFQFVKRIDSASAKLMVACASGQHFQDVTLSCRRAGGTQAEFLNVKLENVIVSSYESSGGEGEVRNSLPVDTFHLNFAKITVNYKAQTAQGTEGANTQGGWDLLKNTKV
jgi:type VI secretion system secreted protein Hcp